MSQIETVEKTLLSRQADEPVGSIKVSWENLDAKTTIWLVLIHLGCLLAPFTFTWQAAIVFFLSYSVLGLFGISMCYHRLLTHRSFKTPKWVEYVLTVIACLPAQRSPIYWVARHRLHHAVSDMPQDPHTPKQGLLWAHMLWVITDKRVEDENEYYRRWAPDLANDAGHRWIRKTHELWPLLYALSLFLIGGLPFLVWGFFVSLAAVYHFTWIVNSLGHVWGYRNYETGEDSRNNPIVAALSFGDGWHNNHHACPNLAQHGHKLWEVDPTYLMIRAMSFFGLASDIRTVRHISSSEKIKEIHK